MLLQSVSSMALCTTYGIAMDLQGVLQSYAVTRSCFLTVRIFLKCQFQTSYGSLGHTRPL
jgi:hypothetical protein